MALNKILVAYDGSELSEKALDLAIGIALPNEETSLDIVNIVPIPLLNESQVSNLKDIIDMMMEDGKETLYAIDDKIASLGERANTLLLTGTAPATELLKLANGGEYDLIVLGNRGLSGLKEYMGSVSYKVFHASEIPVLVAK
ncbi:universal stress protein [Raoultibacter phocaeensis]|uniref:universal stress protein n=1 Tax=Raoultibacter phocaeensis TaxID=2479841 RepID=UPI00111A2762|nr:universal stress protein [Raoultibacter phocaeensis]